MFQRLLWYRLCLLSLGVCGTVESRFAQTWQQLGRSNIGAVLSEFPAKVQTMGAPSSLSSPMHPPHPSQNPKRPADLYY